MLDPSLFYLNEVWLGGLAVSSREAGGASHPHTPLEEEVDR